MMFGSGRDVLWHVVLISFHSNEPEAVREEVYKRYQTLGEDCGGEKAGILLFKVEHNLDLRKNVHLVEIAVFRSNEDLQQFRAHPKHQEITDILATIADWQVGDIEFTLPTPKPPQVKDLDLMYFDPRN